MSEENGEENVDEDEDEDENSMPRTSRAHATLLTRRFPGSPAAARMLPALSRLPTSSSCSLVSFAILRTAKTLRIHRFYVVMATHATVDTSSRLRALRELMAKPEYNVQAFVVPTEDQRKYISRRTRRKDAYDRA